MKHCIDCGKIIDIESSVPVKYSGRIAYICISCYRRDVRYNPLSGYVEPLVYQNPKNNVMVQTKDIADRFSEVTMRAIDETQKYLTPKTSDDVSEIFAKGFDSLSIGKLTKSDIRRLNKIHKKMVKLHGDPYEHGDPFDVSNVERKRLWKKGMIV